MLWGVHCTWPWLLARWGGSVSICPVLAIRHPMAAALQRRLALQGVLERQKGESLEDLGEA